MYEKIDDYDIISFDVFDTLLIRPLLRPEDVFKHLERCTGEIGFFQERINAEFRVREKLTNDDVFDIKFDDIYDEIDQKYKYIKDLELKLEAKTLRANPFVNEIYKQAVAKNKTIIAVSDMYLSADFLLDLLYKNGYNDIVKLYVSSEYKKIKYNGGLYKIVIDDFRDKKILHIGDNEISDCERAKENGIDSYFCQKKSEKFINENKQFYNLYEDKTIDSSIILSSIRDFEKTSNYWFNFGYCCAGPVCYAFTKFILDEALKNNIEELLFVARDCYTINKAFELFKQNNIKNYYIYAQRIFKIKCLLNYDGEHNKDFLISIFKEKSSEFKSKLPEKFNSEDEKEEFILSNKSLLEPYAEEFKNEYVDYLKNLGILGKNNIAMVDLVAFNFSAQTLLNNILNKNLLGIYLQKFGDSGKNMNFIKYCKSNEDFSNIWNFMEFIFTSPELPVLDIKNPEPIYQNSPAKEELKRKEIYPHIMEGMLSFCKDLIKKFGNDFLPSFSSEKIVDFVNCYCNSLGEDDKKYFKDIYFCSADDSEHSNYSVSLWDEITKNNS